MPQDASEYLTKAKTGMQVWGYRPIIETDLTPNQELILVDVSKFATSSVGLSPSHAPGCISIKLDEKPIKLSNSGDGSKVVYYHCTMPPWNGQCFVPLDDLIHSEHISDGMHANDYRYFVKNRQGLIRNESKENSMTSTTEIIEDAFADEALAEARIEPSILMNRNINHEQVEEYTDCYVNEPNRFRLSALIRTGWVVFRIQTEFGINGHYTVAYLAKMKES